MLARLWGVMVVAGCEPASEDEPTTNGPIGGKTAPGDADSDGFTIDAGDCDDTDPDIHPGAGEICDGLDQDCNGIVDDGPIDGNTYYRDDDDDGFGVADATIDACARPDGYAAVDGDCDDSDPQVNPAAQDLPGEDRNCDGLPGLPELAFVDVQCAANDATVTLEMELTTPVSGGFVFMADTANFPTWSEEHRLLPVAPDANGQSATLSLTLDTDAGSVPDQVPGLSTLFWCDSFFELGDLIMSYVFAAVDDTDMVIVCAGAGHDPDVLFTQTDFIGAGTASFDTSSCVALP